MGKRDFETLPRYYKMGQFSRSDAAREQPCDVFKNWSKKKNR